MYRVWGKVREGKKRGTSLGFPTANIKLRKDIPEGIYISKTRIGKKNFPSVTFIGETKTFAEETYQAETYIFSYDSNIYNKWITVTLVKKIRSSKKFSSKEALITAIRKDVAVAKKYLNYV